MNLVVVWHAGAAFPERLEALANQPDVDLTLIVPQVWTKGLVQPAIASKMQQTSFPVIALHAACQIKEVFHYYPALSETLHKLKPALLYLIEEHYSFVTFQALRWRERHSPKTAFAFRTWQNIAKNYPVPFRWMERHVLKRADGAISANQEGAAILQRKGLAGKLAIIPDGVDTRRFNIEVGLEKRVEILKRFQVQRESVPLIGFIGRLVPEKGLETLFRAFSEVSSEARLVMIGAGRMQKELEGLSRVLGIQDSVLFADAVSRNDMPHWLAALDVLVLPSLSRPNWKEQFGRILVEAMACGVPVIGADSGEIPQVIGDGGVVFAQGDVLALSEWL
ncbi:MAG TPA: glycosyltransferase, partial [bacterium]|nr:glycosyltransferase [bacterium]